MRPGQRSAKDRIPSGTPVIGRLGCGGCPRVVATRVRTASAFLAALFVAGPVAAATPGTADPGFRATLAPDEIPDRIALASISTDGEIDWDPGGPLVLQGLLAVPTGADMLAFSSTEKL